ncbi:hypothetical protein MNBD_GAMMA07-1439 [hydrothermal vent metagenome]|uniref:Solute-binding protein family 3/N-terminal domain-containing protein n=1 Tax=hydrothermal vent metagenome TaxID=652676 RepID=A0A3B0WME9_9ZZZZ
MKIDKFWQQLILCTSLFLYAFTLSAESFNVGVQAPRSAIKALTKWKELGKYLKSELDADIKIIPLNPSVTIDAVKNGKVDFILANPAITVAIREKYKAKPFATMNKKFGSLFSGVIISKKGSGIKSVADLKGKKVMTYKKKSAAAYVFQVKYLMDKGISVSDFASTKIAKKQDDIVLAVKAGLFDAGFVKSGLLESMAAEGKIKIDDVDIVDKKTDSLSQIHSTALYPQWCFSAVTEKGSNVLDKVKTALIKLSSDSAAAKKAKIVGFVPLEDLSVMAETLKALKMSPYN